MWLASRQRRLTKYLLQERILSQGDMVVKECQVAREKEEDITENYYQSDLIRFNHLPSISTPGQQMGQTALRSYQISLDTEKKRESLSHKI